MNVAGEPDVTVESAEDVAATEAKAAGETVTAEADAVKDALAEAEKRFVRLQATLIISSDAHCRKKDQLAGFVKADVMKDLFSVLDNFERALQAPTNAETKAFLDGFVMIHQNLMAMLSKHGLAVIDAVANRSIRIIIKQSCVCRLMNMKTTQFAKYCKPVIP